MLKVKVLKYFEKGKDFDEVDLKLIFVNWKYIGDMSFWICRSFFGFGDFLKIY